MWPSESIELHGHYAKGRTMQANIRECMEYITVQADPVMILEDLLFRMMAISVWDVACPDKTGNYFDNTT